MGWMLWSLSYSPPGLGEERMQGGEGRKEVSDAKGASSLSVLLVFGWRGFLALAKKEPLADEKWRRATGGRPGKPRLTQLTQPKPPLWEGAHPPRRTFHNPRLIVLAF